ncbi:MAG TPA: peptidoglycan-binding domain-containing protein [Tianweitania sediminis]|nr:peptidoglycan-binding domain-containing protein [Tianweitania sediminis]
MAGRSQKASAKARKPQPAAQHGVMHRAASASATAIARNPVAVGGSTAFLVALFFVSANAVWYQPHVHSGAFFATRDLPQMRTPSVAPSLLQPEDRIEQPDGADTSIDLTVQQVQTALQDLKLYRGPVDGRMGSGTSEAISIYQKILGQPTTGRIDDTLLNHLGIETNTASVGSVPVPTDPIGRTDEVASLIAEPGATPEPNRISQVQAGLRAFGDHSVEVDGLMGAKTRSAIREFQALFGLAVTGEPTDEVYAKMREIGLTN